MGCCEMIKTVYIICVLLLWTNLLVRAAIVHTATGTKRLDLTLLSQPITAQHHDQPIAGQFCVSRDALYAVGRSFTEKCRRCQCLEGGRKECVRLSQTSDCPDEDVYTDREHTCIQWTDDGCCCLRYGCQHQGRIYDLNTTLPVNPSKPCEIQHCDPETGQIKTRHKVCRPMCIDGVFFPGVCCAVCPNGRVESTEKQRNLAHPRAELHKRRGSSSRTVGEESTDSIPMSRQVGGESEPLPGT